MTSVFWSIVAGLSIAATPAQAAPSVCQRMAAELPMKEKRVDGVVRAFDMQTLSTTQRWLTGGSSYFTMKLEPVDDSEAEEQRIEDMCATVPCTMQGPFRFTLGLKDGSLHVFEATATERARVESVGTRIRCSDLK